MGPPVSTDARLAALTWRLAFGLAAVVALACALRYRSVTYAAAFALLGTVAAVGGALVRRAGGPRWALAAAALCVVVVVPELGARLVGFRYEPGVQFGWPRLSQFTRLVRDERLFWKYSRDVPGVNALGFRGPEIATPKPNGAYRIMFLGDSCVDQGYPYLAQRLLRLSGAPQAEAVSLAMPGYSSHQGRVLAAMYAGALAPDAVVVSYGWNDHWLAYGQVDRDKRGVGLAEESPWLRRSRLLQGAAWLRSHVAPGVSLRPLAETRVPPAHYSDNLEAIAEAFAARGARVVFVTPPTSHYALGVPDGYVAMGYARRPEDVTGRHREYNAIVRAVAERSGAVLLDAERLFLADERIADLFQADGVHFSDAGLAAMAHLVARALEGHSGAPLAPTM